MFRVLIVEKNTVYSRMVKKLIVSQYAFIDVRDVVNGQEAIRKVKLLVPDIVIVSIHIAGINGLELVQRIKSINEETIVIVLSNFNMDEYRKSSLASGADYFFTKDFASEEMLQVIHDQLPPEERTGPQGSLVFDIKKGRGSRQRKNKPS